MEKISIKILVAFLCLALLIACRKNNNNNQQQQNGNGWIQKAPLPGLARVNHKGFSLNGKGYVFAGSNGTPTFLKDLWQYDPNTNQWTEKAPLPFPGQGRIGSTVFELNGEAYIVGGVGAGITYFNDVWAYSPNSNSWEKRADLPVGNNGNSSAVGFAINGKGYIATGISSIFTGDLWEYDPINDSWTQKASLPPGKGRARATGFVLNNKGYVAGGADGADPFDDLWEYDPVSNQWTEKAAITMPYNDRRLGAMSFVLNNKAFVVGGEQVVNGYFFGLNEAWAYDVVNNKWAACNYLPDGIRRCLAANFVINNKAYIVGGAQYIINGQDTTYKRSEEVWEFSPE